MSSRYAAAAPVDQLRSRLERIDEHLERLAGGHDPLGHLLAIERLARANRSDWTPSLQASGSKRR